MRHRGKFRGYRSNRCCDMLLLKVKLKLEKPFIVQFETITSATQCNKSVERHNKNRGFGFPPTPQRGGGMSSVECRLLNIDLTCSYTDAVGDRRVPRAATVARGHYRRC